jgi:hypothetical protein
MPKNIISTLLKLIVASLAVGFVMDYLELTPKEALKGLGNAVVEVFQMGSSVFEWGFSYILLGAAVVIPIWLIATGWKMLRNK